MVKIISVIDDDRSILEVVTLLLEDEGFTVLPYTDATVFLNDISNHQPDMVLLDNTIGETNGKDLADAIKQRISIPVIMVSGSSDVVTHPSIDAFIRKPFSIDTLLTQINAYIT